MTDSDEAGFAAIPALKIALKTGCKTGHIRDQQQPVRILSAILRAGKVPHAMLFTGIEGIGKTTVARMFAMACNCAGKAVPVATDAGSASKTLSVPKGSSLPLGACGCCRSCRKIQGGSHPDVIRVEPSGQFIRIAQIRQLLSTLAMKPYEAKLRVVIISDAHAMNPEAGNALLKILEEPPDRTILIITACGTAELLPTVVSRCQQIRFNPLSRTSLAQMLVERENVSPEKAQVLAAMADGSLSRAVALCRQNWIERRNGLVNAIHFFRPNPAARPPVSVLLAIASRLVEKKQTAFDTLEILKTLYRDIAVSRFHHGRMINEDLSDSIFHAAKYANETDIFIKLAAIETARKRIRANANPKLTMELLLVRLADYYPATPEGFGGS